MQSDDFRHSILAFAKGDILGATLLMTRAADKQPESALFPAARAYLENVRRQGKTSVYDSAEAFAAFTDGGGNVPLYRAVHSALRQIYSEYRSLHLLDIGVGHGLALVPALTHRVEEVTLVEPSEALLERAVADLAERGFGCHPYAETLQSFSERVEGNWLLAQATFSLQSLPPEERPQMLAWLRHRVARLLIVEFDVIGFGEALSLEHIASVQERYERGLAEYEGSRELVAQGFLMPVMFGYFDRSKERTNYEQPIEDWAEQLRVAGFSSVNIRPLHDYWWAPACLIDASR